MNKKIKVILADCYLNMENCPPLIATDNIILHKKSLCIIGLFLSIRFNAVKASAKYYY